MQGKWFAPLLVLAGCAAPRAEKMPFDEAFRGLQPMPAKAAGRTVTAAAKARRPEAETSLELRSALMTFGARARVFRAAVPRGGAMSEDHADAWRSVLAAVDGFLARRAAATSSYDVVRARVTLEAELELDARAYGEFPPELAELVLAKVTRLGVRMAQVRTLGVRTKQASSALAWPLDPVTVTSLFGPRLHPISGTYRMHTGVDLAAERGQLVSAAGPGTVVFAGYNGAHGKHVEIQHAALLVTRYSHLSQLLVEPGITLGKGDPVGLAGSTGHSTGVHLHFEVLRAGKPVDPLEDLAHPLPAASEVAAR